MIDKSFYYKYLFIDFDSVTPLYVQLANAITKAIKDKYLPPSETLPSINVLSSELELSRDTVEKAYKRLKKQKILDSIPGKGYFIVESNTHQRYNILLLFNKLSAHKKLIYDAFFETMDDNATISFYIYNNDYHLFKKILEKKLEQNDYTHYVIIPHFIDMEDKAIELIDKLPKEKLVLLGKKIKEVKGNYTVIYEDFENDIYHALKSLEKKLQPYKKINLIFPQNSYHSKDILLGFEKYCKEKNKKFAILSTPEKAQLKKNTLFITLTENDLVTLIEYIITTKFQLGKDMGIISYNEVAIKKIILDGITTFSTDFEWMGKKAAEMIMQNNIQEMAVPFYVNMRNSI